MAQQQQQQSDESSASSMDAQLNDMINELYGNEITPQTGRFVPMVQENMSPRLLGNRTRPTTVSSPRTPNRRPMANENYQYRTLGAHNFARMTILPLFPTTNVNVEKVSTTSPRAHVIPAKIAHLLLANVPIGLCNPEHFARIRRGTYPTLFQLNMNSTTTDRNDSFLLRFYHDLYSDLAQRMKVDISILDFNLTRLRLCVDQVVAHYHLKQTMLNMDELASALEFYLQMDVDMFFLKTCSFNGAKPRIFQQRHSEGLFCVSTPTARFTITPCGKSTCHCCHPPCPLRNTTVIPFSLPHIHRFVNQYEAILNCQATCESENCIYVLTCPCGQFDFVGESAIPFAETMALHREEGNRIVREFLIGERNIEYLTQGSKSDKKKANDDSWLYQHSARCSVALQAFLEYNPEYWCFVPTKTVEQQQQQQMIQGQTVRGYLARQPATHRELPAASDLDFSTTWNRRDAEVRLLMSNLPEPPFGYSFNSYQRQQQANFFKWAQDRNVPLHNVDLYNPNIVAILPDNASKVFRKLIESLFITHADCKLNQMGHLLSNQIAANTNPNRSLESVWCVNMTHHPASA